MAHPNMKTHTLIRTAVVLMATGFTLLQAGQASAATGTAPYSIVVKDARGGFMSCPPSGLSFTDSQLKTNGFYPAEASPAPQITICSGLNATLLPFAFTTNQSLQVGVFQSTVNGQDQGANVAGLQGRMTGTKTLTNGSQVKLAIDFTTTPAANGAFTRSYVIKIVPATGAERQVAVGSFHISNPASVPEPGTLALVSAGILGFAFMARRSAVKRSTI